VPKRKLVVTTQVSDEPADVEAFLDTLARDLINLDREERADADAR
jgi:hypothetical protein